MSDIKVPEMSMPPGAQVGDVWKIIGNTWTLLSRGQPAQAEPLTVQAEQAGHYVTTVGPMIKATNSEVGEGMSAEQFYDRWLDDPEVLRKRNELVDRDAPVEHAILFAEAYAALKVREATQATDRLAEERRITVGELREERDALKRKLEGK